MNGTMTVAAGELCPKCFGPVTACDVAVVIGGRIEATFWHYPKTCVVVYAPERKKKVRTSGKDKA